LWTLALLDTKNPLGDEPEGFWFADQM